MIKIEIGPTGSIARVTAVPGDRHRAFLEFSNGKTGWAHDLEHELHVGDVVLISGEESPYQMEFLPGEFWPGDPWIGVVRIKLPDVTVVDSAGRFRRVPTTDGVTYSEGNTVEVGDFVGVIRVIAEQPIKSIDLPELDSSVVDQFRYTDDQNESLDFKDFGGLKSVVARAKELIDLPLRRHDELKAIGARPIKGVLFTGPPGTGKTMLARIIAAEAGADFFEISGPAIFSKWYGQSEELLRRIFDAATTCTKAIIFFDEIDSVAAQRDGDAHEASKRVVAQLLTLMDGFASDSNVIIIATTNRPQDLDVALRRPGRFDWEIDFPLPDTNDREDILVKTAENMETQGPLPHHLMATQTDGWSAAELAAIWTEASLLAVADARSAIFLEDYLGGFERVSRQRARVGKQTTEERSEA